MIQFRYHCDGIWHCPNGEEEHNCTKFLLNCSGFFKCTSSAEKHCIHMVDVCNGVKDCHSSEDEYFCDLPKLCAFEPYCKCLLYATKCERVTLNYFSLKTLMSYTVHLHLNDVSVTLSSFRVEDQVKTRSFIWTSSSLTDICSPVKWFSQFLKAIDFAGNQLHTLPRHCFASTENLQIITLPFNVISKIEQNAFQELKMLSKLDLSSNALNTFYSLAFMG